MRSEPVITRRGAAILVALTLAAPAALVASGQAEPPQGVSATVLSRASCRSSSCARRPTPRSTSP